ncbi:MAG: ribonuclease D [Syntrophales bacterium]|jgi:ribonuclease D|nr:ribonuclease D [Syntrophales bacterium]MDY0045313.1 ribonuclease D [Syntrophales bacterium]
MDQPDIILVETVGQWENAKKYINEAVEIGVDTEYDSFRYFREVLCLIQVSTDSAAYLFDPLGDLDLSFLGSKFADRNTRKILHACDNDIRLLSRDYSFEFSNIFDTHRAAALLGSPLLSLPSILKDYLGVELKKDRNLQRSRWDIRPLSREQMRYAAQDVIFLIPLYRKLDEDLKRRQLTESAYEAFRAMASVRWREKKLDRKGHMRIAGFEELDEKGRDRLKRLYEWRFEKARSSNRARFMILSDKELAALAGSNIDSIESLMGSDAVSSRKKDEYGNEIAELLKYPGPLGE